MYYVQFYQPSAIDPEKIIEACGDRSVFILDGRNTGETMRADALRAARSPSRSHYTHYEIRKSSRDNAFSPSRSLSPIFEIDRVVRTGEW